MVRWACERGTPPTFSWTEVTLTSPHPESPHSSVLTLTPRPQDHGINLTCRVTFPGAGVSRGDHEAQCVLWVGSQEPESWRMRGKEMKGPGWDTRGLFLQTSWGEDTETSASPLTPDPCPHHNAAGFLFLSLPDALQNLDIRVFWENSTGVRSLGSKEVR